MKSKFSQVTHVAARDLAPIPKLSLMHQYNENKRKKEIRLALRRDHNKINDQIVEVQLLQDYVDVASDEAKEANKSAPRPKKKQRRLEVFALAFPPASGKAYIKSEVCEQRGFCQRWEDHLSRF